MSCVWGGLTRERMLFGGQGSCCAGFPSVWTVCWCWDSQWFVCDQWCTRHKIYSTVPKIPTVSLIFCPELAVILWRCEMWIYCISGFCLLPWVCVCLSDGNTDLHGTLCLGCSCALYVWWDGECVFSCFRPAGGAGHTLSGHWNTNEHAFSADDLCFTWRTAGSSCPQARVHRRHWGGRVSQWFMDKLSPSIGYSSLGSQSKQRDRSLIRSQKPNVKSSGALVFNKESEERCK